MINLQQLQLGPGLPKYYTSDKNRVALNKDSTQLHNGYIENLTNIQNRGGIIKDGGSYILQHPQFKNNPLTPRSQDLYSFPGHRNVHGSVYNYSNLKPKTNMVYRTSRTASPIQPLPTLGVQPLEMPQHAPSKVPTYSMQVQGQPVGISEQRYNNMINNATSTQVIKQGRREGYAEGGSDDPPLSPLEALLQNAMSAGAGSFKNSSMPGNTTNNNLGSLANLTSMLGGDATGVANKASGFMSKLTTSGLGKAAGVALDGLNTGVAALGAIGPQAAIMGASMLYDQARANRVPNPDAYAQQSNKFAEGGSPIEQVIPEGPFGNILQQMLSIKASNDETIRPIENIRVASDVPEIETGIAPVDTMDNVVIIPKTNYDTKGKFNVDTKGGRNALFGHWMEVAQSIGHPYPVLAASQAALESGWGKHSISGNLFGIKGSGKAVASAEYDAQGNKRMEVSSFRTAGSELESFMQHKNLMMNKRYASRINPNANIFEQAKAVQAAGYATDPTYANQLSSVARSMGFSEGGQLPAYEDGGPGDPNKQQIGNSGIYFDSNKTWKDNNGNLVASDLATGKHYKINQDAQSGLYDFKRDLPTYYTNDKELYQRNQDSLSISNDFKALRNNLIAKGYFNSGIKPFDQRYWDPVKTYKKNMSQTNGAGNAITRGIDLKQESPTMYTMKDPAFAVVNESLGRQHYSTEIHPQRVDWWKSLNPHDAFGDLRQVLNYENATPKLNIVLTNKATDDKGNLKPTMKVTMKSNLNPTVNNTTSVKQKAVETQSKIETTKVSNTPVAEPVVEQPQPKKVIGQYYDSKGNLLSEEDYQKMIKGKKIEIINTGRKVDRTTTIIRKSK